MKINRSKYDIAFAEAQITVTELGRLSGISPMTISRIINGVQSPRHATVGKIAHALGVKVEDLIEEV